MIIIGWALSISGLLGLVVILLIYIKWDVGDISDI